MQAILHEINLTRDLFDLEIEIKVDGEVYIRTKANSLTENFLSLMFNMMGIRRSFGIKDIYHTRMDQTAQDIPFSNLFGRTILSVTTSDPRTVVISTRINVTDVGDGVQVSGVRTPAGINGRWIVESLAVSEREITLANASLAIVGNSAYVSGNTPSFVLGFDSVAQGIGDGFNEDETFYRPWICVGVGAETTTKLDWALKNFVKDGSSTGQLVYESMIVAVPAVAGNTSTITVTRDFTNNSGATVAIKEVGLFAGGWRGAIYSSDLAMILIARDLSAFTIPNGSTIEVSYRFNTSSVAAGGFLRQFGELMYRQMSGLSREAKDLDNASQTFDESFEQFRLAVGGGSSYLDASPNVTANRPMQYTGVQVGLASTPVAFANFGLSSKVFHGVAANQLFHYGTVVDNWLSNTTTNKFDISGLFENQSGATVSILETGLHTDNDDKDSQHAIARHALAAAVDVPDGQCLKVIYRLSV